MKAKYLCDESELYTGLNLLAKALEDELVEFRELKPMYTSEFVAGLRAQIKAAQSLPDEVQRKSALKGKRFELKRMTRGKVSDMMGSLRSYIREAYSDKELRKVKLAGAGFGRLREAMWYDWEVLNGMLEVADTFIKDNEEELKSAGSMPVDFWEKFKVARAEAEEMVTVLLKGRGQMKVDRQGKVRANNVVFGVGMRICMDGKLVFKRNMARRDRFVWEAVMEAVTPVGASGLKGWVKVNGSFEPVVGAEIKLQQAGEPMVVRVTDIEGNFVAKLLKRGVYSVEVVVDGVVKLREVVKLARGRMSYKKWKV